MDRNVVIHAGSNRTLIAGFNEESMRAASKKDDKWMETKHDWDLFREMETFIPSMMSG